MRSAREDVHSIDTHFPDLQYNMRSYVIVQQGRDLIGSKYMQPLLLTEYGCVAYTTTYISSNPTP